MAGMTLKNFPRTPGTKNNGMKNTTVVMTAKMTGMAPGTMTWRIICQPLAP